MSVTILNKRIKSGLTKQIVNKRPSVQFRLADCRYPIHDVANNITTGNKIPETLLLCENEIEDPFLHSGLGSLAQWLRKTWLRNTVSTSQLNKQQTDCWMWACP